MPLQPHQLELRPPTVGIFYPDESWYRQTVITELDAPPSASSADLLDQYDPPGLGSNCDQGCPSQTLDQDSTVLVGSDPIITECGKSACKESNRLRQRHGCYAERLLEICCLELTSLPQIEKGRLLGPGPGSQGNCSAERLGHGEPPVLAAR